MKVVKKEFSRQNTKEKREKKIRTTGKLLEKHGSKSTWNSTSTAVVQCELAVNSATAGCLARRKTNCHLLSSCIFFNVTCATNKEIWVQRGKIPSRIPPDIPAACRRKHVRVSRFKACPGGSSCPGWITGFVFSSCWSKSKMFTGLTRETRGWLPAAAGEAKNPALGGCKGSILCRVVGGDPVEPAPVA